MMLRIPLAAVLLLLVGVALLAAPARGDYAVESLNASDAGIAARLVLRTAVLPEYGVDISPLALDIRFESDDHVRVRIFDPNSARWEVPLVLQDDRFGGGGPATRKYDVQVGEDPFDVRVVRRSDGEVLFDSGVLNRLVFKDLYIELPTALPEDPSIYGLGERVHPLRLDTTPGRIFTIWSNDHGTPVDDNLYGSHPFYLERRADGDAHGALLLSTNGMDIVFAPGTLTFKVIGGIIDLFVFVGPTPGDVVAQYTRVIGRPHMIPYWVLGYHQCRWGYLNLDDVKDVVAQYQANNIPLDTMWTDIDYMERYRDFTFSPTRFPRDDVTAFSRELRTQGLRYMLIADPAISNQNDGYEPYERGTEMNVWILDANGTAPYTGIVWPGSTVFPDWLHPNTSVWWENELRLWIGDDLALSGLWIDMNEVDNFQTLAELPRDREDSAGTASVTDPPYDINNQGNKNPLIRKTIAMDAIHYGGILEYDAHSMYGHAMSISTRAAIDRILGRRGLVLSRSTFPGTGKYAGHWLGDNTSRWADLYYSIPGMLSFQLFGIPLVGADICGFVTSTTEELCARWTTLGSFYTFARNHNAILMAPQEPYQWPTVAEAARRSLQTRYRILPYYYTLFYQAHTAGATVLRPLFFEFADEPLAELAALDRQFLVGSAVLITPVLEEGVVSVDGYFPTAARWYDINNGRELTSGWQTLALPLEDIGVHVRGGTVVPAQAPGLSTSATRLLPFELIVALDATGAATGELFLDDGESLGAIDGGEFTLLTFAAIAGRLVSTVVRAGYSPTADLGVVSLWGVGAVAITSVRLDGAAVPFTQEGSAVTVTISPTRSLLTPFVLDWA